MAPIPSTSRQVASLSVIAATMRVIVLFIGTRMDRRPSRRQVVLKLGLAPLARRAVSPTMAGRAWRLPGLCLTRDQCHTGSC